MFSKSAQASLRIRTLFKHLHPNLIYSNTISQSALLAQSVHSSTQPSSLKPSFKNKKISQEIIKSLLNKAEDYKEKTKEPDKRILMEMYGFALGLSRYVEDPSSENIEKRIVKAIKEFALDELHLKKEIELSNLPNNFKHFKTQLENIRLRFDIRSFPQSVVYTQQCFEALIRNMFSFNHGILGQPPSNNYAILSVGSLATQMATPYSDIEYVVLVEKNTDESKIYFNNFSDLFELMMIGFGESPIYKADALLEEYKEYYKYIKKGSRVDEHKKPQDINRAFGLINTPEELLKSLPTPTKIIHEPGNHITAALLTTGFLEGNQSLYSRYQQLYKESLEKTEYRQCLTRLLQESLRSCEGTIANLENNIVKQKLDETIEVKELLIHGIHLARMLVVFLKSSGQKVELRTKFSDVIETLKSGFLHQELYQNWLHLVNTLFFLRVELQLKNQSAEAKITLRELNQKYDILAICQVLKEIAGIVRCQLEKNKNAVSLNINERNNSSLDTSSGQLLTANNSNQVNCNASNKERNDNSGNSNNDAWSRGEIIAAAGLALTAIGAVPTIAYLWEQISKKKAKKIDNAELIPQFDHLVARTQLEELQRKAQGSIEPVLHIAITGFAGTGKTVLAQNYANEYMEQHPTAKLRWYIRAEKESTRFEDYKKLARVLGIQFNEDTNIKKLSEKVNEALLKYPEFILIFDNVPSYKEIEVLLPKGNQLKGQVLLTSRRKDVLPTDKFPSQIKSDLNSGLNQEESLRLLQQLTRLSMEQEPEKSAARELTEQLGCLPLSLVQAATYIDSREITYKGYLDLYKVENAGLLKDEHLPTVYEDVLQSSNAEEKDRLRSYDAVLRLNFKNLSPSARGLLRLCAYLSPDNIPTEILKSCENTEKQFRDDIWELKRYSLINAGKNEKNISIHRIIQLATKLEVREQGFNHEQGCLDKILELLHIQHRLGVETEFDYRNKSYLIPHFEAVLSNKELKEFNLKMCQGMVDYALLFKAIGHAKDAGKYYEQVLPFVNADQNDLAVEVYQGLGRAHQGSGDFNQARIHYENAYQIVSKQPNSERNPTLAAILNDLGMIYRDIGHQLNNDQSRAYFVEALKQLKKAVDIVEGISNQNKNLVRYKINLGEVYRQQRNLNEANKVIHQAIKMGQTEFKDEKHRIMASAYFNLGNVYLDKGDSDSNYYLDAKNCFEKAVNIGKDENVAGPEHPLVARHMDALGVAWRKLGDETKACECFQEAFDILQNSKTGQSQLKELIRKHLESCDSRGPRP